jgi:hypothetical protein
MGAVITQDETRSSPKEVSTALELATRVDLAHIYRSAQRVVAWSEYVVAWFEEHHSAAGATPRKPHRLTTVEGTVLYHQETPLGLFVVGGGDHNAYRGAFGFIADVGGNDFYELEASSLGGRGRVSLVLDMSGNDDYRGATTPLGGSGVAGVNLTIDLAGDDIYRGGYCSQGCGMLGVGILYDSDGDDLYHADQVSQGAGLFGMGLLLDGGGDDTYESARMSQGFASMEGCGLLIDRGGNDHYHSGGVYPDPREDGKYTQSLSQGFSIGLRPLHCGGVAILFDKSGDDHYGAEYFAQGASYWLSLGILMDGGGNDHYRARRYAQGAGIHLSVGLLADSRGNDIYDS